MWCLHCASEQGMAWQRPLRFVTDFVFYDWILNFEAQSIWVPSNIILLPVEWFEFKSFGSKFACHLVFKKINSYWKLFIIWKCICLVIAVVRLAHKWVYYWISSASIDGWWRRHTCSTMLSFSFLAMILGTIAVKYKSGRHVHTQKKWETQRGEFSSCLSV